LILFPLLRSIIKSILTVSAGTIFTKGGNYKEKTSALINTEFRRTQQHKLKWLILQSLSTEPQRVTEKHFQALCSPVSQATVLGAMLPAHPFLARVGTSVSRSVSGSLRNTRSWIRTNERHCKNMRDLVSWESRQSSLQEQETSCVPSNNLALPSRQGATRSLPCHYQITIQVTTHDGKEGVFDPQGAVAVLMSAALESPALQPSLPALTGCARPASAQRAFSWTCTASGL